MTSSGLEKRGSFLGDYPMTRQSHGRAHMTEAVSTVSSVTTSASSWLSGVRASFRGKSAGQQKLKSGASGSQLQVPGSRVSLLLHNSYNSPSVTAALAAKAKRSNSHNHPSGGDGSCVYAGPVSTTATAACSNGDGFAVPAPPPPLPPAPHQIGDPAGGGDGNGILDNLTNAVASGWGHLHLLTHNVGAGGDHGHSSQLLPGAVTGKGKKGSRSNKMTL